jgi:Adenosine deaminase
MLITMCYISNLVLQCGESIAELATRVYLESGVKSSINSDNCGYFGVCTLENNCFVLPSNRGQAGIETASIGGSWSSEHRKTVLAVLSGPFGLISGEREAMQTIPRVFSGKASVRRYHFCLAKERRM